MENDQEINEIFDQIENNYQSAREISQKLKISLLETNDHLVKQEQSLQDSSEKIDNFADKVNRVAKSSSRHTN